MNGELLEALDKICREKKFSKEILIKTLKQAILTVYQKEYRYLHNNIEVNLDEKTGNIKIFLIKKVVLSVSDEKLEISLEKAREKNPNVQINTEIKIEVSVKDLGRISAQAVKHIITQRIFEVERESIYEEYQDKIGTVISGKINRIEDKNIILDLGKTTALIPPKEQFPQNKDKIGETIKSYIIEVRKISRGSQIIASRTHPNLVKCLFEIEVPEILEGIIEIKSVARDVGKRTKIAVFSNNTNIEAVGTCVGIKGSRVQAITKELKGEKIDIIEWNENPEIFIKNSLRPGEVSKIILNKEEKRCEVILPDNQLPLAIGKNGQNIRLAVKLTGWKINIITPS